MIIFDSVRFIYKKSNKTEFFLKKNRNRTETGSNRPVLVRFGFYDKNRFKPVWFGFFPVWLGSVRFFQFQSYKTETELNRTSWFFQNFNQFNRVFFTVRFYRLFFFLVFSVYSVFLLTPIGIPEK
jgi:hypothetical protein